MKQSPNSPNKTLETNRRPAAPLDAGRICGRAVHAQPGVSGGGRSVLALAIIRNPKMKKHPSILTLLWATMLACGCAVESPAPSDPAIREKLIGTWIIDRAVGERSVLGEATLNADGTFAFHAILTDQGTNQPFSLSGSWVVRDGYLIETVTNHTNPERIGNVTRDVVLRVDDSAFQYRTESGTVVTRARKKQGQP